MKKIIFLVSIFIMFAFSAQAKTEEWIDKNYDFSKIKRLIVAVKIPNEIKNGIRENEITEVFYEKLREHLYEKTLKSKVKVFNMIDVVRSFEQSTGIIINEAPYEQRAEIGKKLTKFMTDHSDALLAGQVWVYDLGTSYHEGYYYTLPSQAYSTVTTNIGVNATVRTDSQTLHHKPGGNYPTAYCFVRWDLSDAKTDKQVWSRLDERARVNSDPLQNTKPKDLLGRICKSMCEDLLKQLKVKE